MNANPDTTPDQEPSAASQAEPRTFRQINKRWDELRMVAQRRDPTMEERIELIERTNERNRLGENANNEPSLDFFAEARPQLDAIQSEIIKLSNTDALRFLQSYDSAWARNNEALMAQSAATLQPASPDGKTEAGLYEGIVEDYLLKGVERLRLSYLSATGASLRQSASELFFENVGDWEYRVDPSEFKNKMEKHKTDRLAKEKAEKAERERELAERAKAEQDRTEAIREALRKSAEAQEKAARESAEELRKTREAQERASAEARRQSGKTDYERINQLKERVRSMSVDEQRDWMRERMARIRKISKPVDELVRMRNNEAVELSSVSLELHEEVQAEYEARKAIFEAGMEFRSAGKAEKAVGAASEITTSVLTDIFKVRVDGVAIIARAYRLYERYGDEFAASGSEKAKLRFQQLIGHMIMDPDFDEQFPQPEHSYELPGNSPLARETRARRAERDNIVSEARRRAEQKLARGDEPDNFWAVKDAEDLFLMLNRAALHEDKTLNYAQKVFSLPNRLSKDGIGVPWFRDKSPTGGNRFVNLYIRDFWTTLALEDKKDFNGPQFNQTWAFRSGLLNRFQDLDDSTTLVWTRASEFKWEDLDLKTDIKPENRFFLYWGDVAGAETAMANITDTKSGILNNPTEAMVFDAFRSKAFPHLKGLDLDAALANYLEAVLIYSWSKPGIPGKQSIAQEDGKKGWVRPLNRDYGRQIIKKFEDARLFSSPDSPYLRYLKENYGYVDDLHKYTSSSNLIDNGPGMLAKAAVGTAKVGFGLAASFVKMLLK